MSADNFIAIREIVGKNTMYEVKEKSSEGKDIFWIGTFSDLREALVRAGDYQWENDVEYGITFVPKK